MNRRTMGCTFVAIAAFLYASRYVAAAIYMSNIGSHGRDWIQRGMSYIGPDLHLWAFAALVIGVVYLALGEWSELKQHK